MGIFRKGSTATGRPGIYRRFMLHVRNYLLSGLFLVIPFAVTVVVLVWLYRLLVPIVRPVVGSLIRWVEEIPVTGAVPETTLKLAVTVAAVLLLLLLLYLIGRVGRLLLGRRLIATGERVVLGVPLVRTIYSASKQVVEALTLPERRGFKEVVIVEFPRAGYKSLAFLTGTLRDRHGRLHYTVFVPTAPNPTSGFLQIVQKEEVIHTSITVEEAFRMILSGGLVAPDLFGAITDGTIIRPGGAADEES